MRKRALYVFAFCLLAPGAAWAQDAPAPHEFTPAMATAIDRLASRQIAARTTPGLAIGVVEDGRLVYARGYGNANISRKTRVLASTEFYAAALAKEFTAAAVLLLQQNKQLSLDDKITKYVPELTAAKDVTIAQLLTQTSGLPALPQVNGIDPDQTKPLKIDDLLKALNQVPLASPPGSKYVYNDLNYTVAGLIVARVSKLPLSDFLQRNIFEPLVMSSTFLAGDQGIAPDRATGYSKTGASFAAVHPYDPSRLFGTADLVTNVYDLAKWDYAMPILLNVDSVRTMWTPVGPPGDLAYGMGWFIDQRSGHRYIWHNGQIAGYHAMNALLPDDHIAVIVLANTDALHSNMAVAPEDLAARILDVVAPAPAVRVDNEIIERAKEWLGRLASADIDRTQLTPRFSTYLSDDFVVKTNFKSFGRVLSMTPLESYSQLDDKARDTVYVFLVRFASATFRYQFVLTPEGKINGLYFKSASSGN